MFLRDDDDSGRFEPPRKGPRDEALIAELRRKAFEIRMTIDGEFSSRNPAVRILLQSRTC
jgi:hypothetical protein